MRLLISKRRGTAAEVTRTAANILHNGQQKLTEPAPSSSLLSFKFDRNAFAEDLRQQDGETGEMFLQLSPHVMGDVDVKPAASAAALSDGVTVERQLP